MRDTVWSIKPTITCDDLCPLPGWSTIASARRWPNAACHFLSESSHPARMTEGASGDGGTSKGGGRLETVRCQMWEANPSLCLGAPRPMNSVPVCVCVCVFNRRTLQLFVAQSNSWSHSVLRPHRNHYHNPPVCS